MKNLIYIFVASVLFVTASCKKEYIAPEYTPEINTWLVNNDTFGPTNFVYYDTAGLMYGGIKNVGSVTIFFREKPRVDGKYVLRAKADEFEEISIMIIDSVKKITWMSTDNDGRDLKVEQFAQVTAQGSRAGVSFNNLFLKRTDNVDYAKVSMNIE